MSGGPLLSVRGLSVDYLGPDGPVRAVDAVSLDVAAGEVLGIAGESGCGKSTFAQAVLRILPPPAVISGGEVLFEGRDLLRLPERELRALRWVRLSMVFQSALESLNPVLTVADQITDVLRAHAFRGAERPRLEQLLSRVGLAADRLERYPHQLSGGERQRVGIALSLALDPVLLILDEPTTALDVRVEHELLQHLRGLQREQGFSVLFITHDLSRMLQVSHRVAIFYAGRLVELAPAGELRSAALHPYTQGLLRAFPSLRGTGALAGIPGAPPSLRDPPPGCRFHPRCDRAIAVCTTDSPPLVQLRPGHFAACHVTAPLAQSVNSR